MGELRFFPKDSSANAKPATSNPSGGLFALVRSSIRESPLLVRDLTLTPSRSSEGEVPMRSGFDGFKECCAPIPDSSFCF